MALRGDNFDGHKFVDQARERGAIGAMVEESWKEATSKSFALIRVSDTLAGYQNLAANYRRSLPTKGHRHHWEQRQDQYERLPRCDAFARIPRHQDRRQF